MMSNLETTSLMPSVLSTSISGLSLRVQSQIRSSLIVAATGLGKTVIMGGLAKTWPKGRVMLISHRYEINQQAIDQLSNICGEEVDLEQAAFEADQRTVPHRVVVASVQTLNSFRRKRQQYRMEKFDPMDFGLLLIDEAHRAAAVTYRRVIKHFLQNPACCVVGVTATPDRLDGVGMGNVFQVASSDLNALWGVENGWLVGPGSCSPK
jgi:superfamily II DNA or RNA helicase